MIRSFRDKETEKVWQRTYSKRIPPDVQRIAYRKLVMLHRSKDFTDLRVPPGNRLESLSGDRGGQHNIRINSQWRICFVWTSGHAVDVEITDYH
jgi:proteic killer suppression protein